MTRTKLLVVAATVAALGLLRANGELTVTSVLPYDFTTLEVIGSAAAGEVTLAVGDKTAKKTLASAGLYTLAVDGLTAGSIYSYTVSQGEASKSGYVAMAGRSDTVFGATTSAPTGGTWDTTPGTADDNKFVFAGSESKFTLDSASSARVVSAQVVYVDSDVVFEDGADELLPRNDALGAFTLAQTNETGSADYFWAGYANGKWVRMTGPNAVIGTYVLRMEYMFDTNLKMVRYSLKSGNDPFVVLKDDAGNDWFAVAGNASGVASVSYEGTGKLASLDGSTSQSDKLARVGDTEYSTLSDALYAATTSSTNVQLYTNVKANPDTAPTVGSWTLDGDYAVKMVTVGGYTSTYSTYSTPTLTVTLENDVVVMSSSSVGNVVVSKTFSSSIPSGSTLDSKALNNYTYLENYVLGLKPADSTSVPIVRAVQNSDSSKLTLSLGDSITVNEGSGVKVTYALKSSESMDFSEVGPSDANDSGIFDIALAGMEKVQYFKIDAILGK